MPSPPLEVLKGAKVWRPFQYRQLKTPMQASQFLSEARSARNPVAPYGLSRLNEKTTDGIRPASPAWQPSRAQTDIP